MRREREKERVRVIDFGESSTDLTYNRRRAGVRRRPTRLSVPQSKTATAAMAMSWHLFPAEISMYMYLMTRMLLSRTSLLTRDMPKSAIEKVKIKSSWKSQLHRCYINSIWMLFELNWFLSMLFFSLSQLHIDVLLNKKKTIKFK